MEQFPREIFEQICENFYDRMTVKAGKYKQAVCHLRNLCLPPVSSIKDLFMCQQCPSRRQNTWDHNIFCLTIFCFSLSDSDHFLFSAFTTCVCVLCVFVFLFSAVASHVCVCEQLDLLAVNHLTNFQQEVLLHLKFEI